MVVNFKFLLALLAFPLASQAEFADVTQVPSKTEKLKFEITVKSDGTQTRKVTRQVLILNEEGRNRDGIFSFNFNKHTETGSILVARTENNGQVTKVDEKNIETKELRERNRQGFESTVSKLITFPKVYVGSRLYVEYEIKTSEFPFIDSWANYFSFNGIIDSVEIDVKSELPLQVYLSDDKFNLEKSEDLKKIRLTSRGPINTQLENEQFSALLENRTHVVLLTSLKNWSEFGKAFIKEYDAILSAPLPGPLEKIVQETAEYKDPVTRLNQMTSRLQRNVRYFGDWARRKGGYIPRSMSEVVKTEFGDCKDMAVVLAAMLRKAGYKADISLIRRGDLKEIDEKAYDLASGSVFNHAITRAEVEGKVYWLDPTNYLSFAQGIPLDIADRPTFVLYKTGGALERTFSYSPSENIYQNDIVLQSNKTGEVKVQATLTRKGNSAFKILRAESQRTLPAFERMIVNEMLGHESTSDIKFQDYPKKLNIVQDVERKFSATLRSYVLNSNEGPAYSLITNGMVRALTVRRAGYEGDLVIGEKFTEKTKTTYKGTQARNLKTFNCQIESKWMDFTRQARLEKGGVVFDNTTRVKVDSVSLEDTKTAEFAKLQEAVLKCFPRRILVFN